MLPSPTLLCLRAGRLDLGNRLHQLHLVGQRLGGLAETLMIDPAPACEKASDITDVEDSSGHEDQQYPPAIRGDNDRIDDESQQRERGLESARRQEALDTMVVVETLDDVAGRAGIEEAHRQIEDRLQEIRDHGDADP